MPAIASPAARTPPTTPTAFVRNQLVRDDVTDENKPIPQLASDTAGTTHSWIR
jgi:hypothetical protein